MYGLAARRSETTGLIERLQEQMDKAQSDLSTLDAALLMWGVDNPETCIRTKKATTAGLFHTRELPRLVRDAIRQAENGATSHQIARTVTVAKCWDAEDERLQASLADKITRLLCEWRRQGRIQGDKNQNGNVVWMRCF